MKTVVAIRHLAFEDLGTFEPVLAQAGYDIGYLDAGVDPLDAAESADLLVVLGGPIGVYEEDRYPFLRNVLALLERRVAASRPVLGVCLGAQLMAAALGARVYPGPTKEIGFAPLALTEEGAASCLSVLEGQPVLHWHGDTFDLPAGAVRLASTAICMNQAFAHGVSALALQFHAEVDCSRIEQWLIGHTGELTRAGVDVRALRMDAAQAGDSLQRASRHLIQDWLSRMP